MKKTLCIFILIISTAYGQTRNIVPRATGQGGVGTSAKNWLEAYIDSLYMDAAFFTDNNASPSVVGELLYDNTLAGVDDGWFCWYDDDEIKYIIDTDTLPTDSEDDYHLAYDMDTDTMYWKVDVGGTPLTEEEVEDFVGGMLGGTETLITVTYEDGTNDIDFVVDNDLANYDNTNSAFITATLTEEAVEDFVGSMLGGTETHITVTYEDATNDIDFVVSPSSVAGAIASGELADGIIIEPDLNADVGATDGDFLQYDSTGTNFTWRSGTETRTDISAQPLEATLTDIADGTIAENLVNTANPWADNEVADDITIDLATLATTVTITDNENTAENNPLVFVEGGDLDGGDLGLESDGTTYYTPSTGVITATGFAGAGTALTALDGENIQNGTIDDDSIDFGDMTDLGNDGVVTWGNVTAGELGNDSVINEDIDDDGGFVFTGAWDFGGGDLEIPQASPAVPGADGGIEVDFTDGSVVIQHGAAHAELAGATDVVVGKLIHSFSATLAFPDDLQDEIDNWALKSIRSSEFPHGIVITECYLLTSAASTYAVNIENWDDFETINAGNPTIDAITTSADTEQTEDTIDYATIAAGQIIMLDLDTDDIGWIYVEVQFYEPAA